MFCSIFSAFIVGGARKVVIGQFSFCGVQGLMAERLKIDHLRQKDQAGSICQSIELLAVQHSRDDCRPPLDRSTIARFVPRVASDMRVPRPPLPRAR
jgi:hypothetical protein